MHARMRAPVMLLALLGACSADGSEPPPGICDGRPCLARVDSTADWAAISVPTSDVRCDLDEESKYLTPAVPDAELAETVYQDVKVHRFHLELMRVAFADRFGGLTPEAYLQLVQRRATRRYFAGTLVRLTDGQTTLGYGFDVIVDPTSPAEQLSAEELAALQAQLAVTFTLPLGYAPRTEEAIARARDFPPLGFPVFLPAACGTGERCADDPTRHCVVTPPGAAACGQFKPWRSIQVEHGRKIRLAFVPGEWTMPEEGATREVTLVAAAAFGPAATPLVPVAPGTLARGAGPDDFLYRQTFTAGADTIDLRWELRFDATPGSGITINEEWASSHLNIAGTVNGSTAYDDSLSIESCTAVTLPRWRAEGALAGGDGFALEIRHQPPEFGSAPLVLTGADVTLGGTAVRVVDYFRLVYAAEHHNWNNQYWVLFAAPLAYSGHDVHGIWIDGMNGTSGALDGAWTLDAALQPLDALPVTSYTFVEQ